MQVFNPKKAPTKVKHYILENYLQAWAGIIRTATRADQRLELRFVDTMCGSGLYHVDPDDDNHTTEPFEPGSALIGPRVLSGAIHEAHNKGRVASARAMLINTDRNQLDTARAAIDAEGIDSVTIDVRLGRFAELEDEVARFCNAAFSFALIDPYGPSPAPLSSVARVVTGRYTDALINFPYLAFQKWTGWLDRDDLTVDQLRKLQGADAFMGGPEWRQVAARVRNDPHVDIALDEALLNHYMGQLSRCGVLVVALPLLFEDKDRPIYHLVFTSHNVAGLAAAKEQFVKGDQYQAYLRERVHERKTGQPGFDFMREICDPEPDIGALADLLHGRFRGQSVTKESVVLQGLMEDNVLEGHVARALTRLKNQGKAAFPSKSRYRDPITFAL